MHHSRLCSRRHFLQANAFGLGSLALASLLRDDNLLGAPVKPHSIAAGPPRYDLLPKEPHFEPKARAMISLFMMGGPSQMDLFDPKPMLTKYDGQKFPGEIKYDNLAQASAKVFGSPFKFSPHGQCGMELSELLPCLGEMGRLPVLQNDAGREKWGRDHNTHGFSHWIAGGGFKRGYVHGETDEWGHKAVKDIVNHYDWHATLLHCFGLDHTKLIYKRNGTAASLTDGQGARVVGELLA